ncbi:hypothetical protein CYMTET_21865 [Cymbomonas tetramitiformis]|uniref:Uncharacterized protein n=1 Tax=Cymbomonas tetramitiformis TaxID=36881 RepID=A0AAE0G1I6_9CHLO|nr:hypothetical protein CYMTET_21865 [Cymbomonas tetramitiformis]
MVVHQALITFILFFAFARVEVHLPAGSGHSAAPQNFSAGPEPAASSSSPKLTNSRVAPRTLRERRRGELGVSRFTELAVQMQEQALKETTRGNYGPKSKKFKDFCEDEGREWLPTSEETVRLYLALVLDRGGIPATSLRPHLLAYHEDMGFPGPAKGRSVSRAVKGMWWQHRRTVNEDQLARALRGELAPEDIVRPPEEAVVEAKAVLAEVAAVAVALRMRATTTTARTLEVAGGSCAVPPEEPESSQEAPAGAGEVPVMILGPAVEVDMAPVVETEIESEVTLVEHARAELEGEVPTSGLASERCHVVWGLSLYTRRGFTFLAASSGRKMIPLPHQVLEDLTVLEGVDWDDWMVCPVRWEELDQDFGPFTVDSLLPGASVGGQ